MPSLVMLYFLIMNGLAFITMYRDKRKARKHQYRISEQRIWLLAWIGGATGAAAGMFLFRHKTKHPSFRIGLPLLMAIQLVFVMYVLMK
jgi:uncharacterized membrane protein YsdA (DUF1294 family)